MPELSEPDRLLARALLVDLRVKIDEASAGDEALCFQLKRYIAKRLEFTSADSHPSPPPQGREPQIPEQPLRLPVKRCFTKFLIERNAFVQHARSTKAGVSLFLKASERDYLGKLFTLRDSILIAAPIGRCFALSTSIEVVALTLAMHPVAYTPEAKLTGMIAANDRLLWRGWKFGLPQLHETLITAFNEPTFFQDTMGRGRFAEFQHDHHFRETPTHTLLRDEVRFAMPFGSAGALVGRLVMVSHIEGLLRRRFALLKSLAEGDGWRDYLDPQF